MTKELWSLTACEVVAHLQSSELTPLDLLEAAEARIAEVDPAVNALPTLCFDRARTRAEALMQKPMAERGRLAGLPLPIKDLIEVEGVRTTFGSPIFQDHIPAQSDIVVQQIETEGGLVFAKSATPEFGAGAQTFNEVFGITRNPWDTSKTCSGSSGGSAVALATGMAWVAHGNDMGGSLRNPASFCGVVGLRPSPGRVARNPGVLADSFLGVEGPMARNVADAALLLDAMTGEHPRDPLSLPRLPGRYLDAALAPKRPLRVAFSADLGLTPVDPEVEAICRAAAERLADDGVDVIETAPDLSSAHDVFQVLRAYQFAASHGEKLAQMPEKLKPEMAWNIEKGLELAARDISQAQGKRTQIIAETMRFFEDFDLLLTPATIVPPFPVEERYVASCNGVTFDNYVGWLAVAYAITLTTAPAMSLPCGFTRSGLPVGLQVVARPRNETGLFHGAAYLEALLGAKITRPIDPRQPRAV